MQKLLIAAVIGLIFTSLANASEEQWVRPDSTMSWGFVANERLHIQFYSQNRPDKIWGPYYLRQISSQLWININCKLDEYICYGAWSDESPGLSSGAGRHGEQKCASCCYRCNGGLTRVISPILR